MDAAGAVDAQNAPTAPLENRPERGFPQRPHASLDCQEREQTETVNRASHTKFLTRPAIGVSQVPRELARKVPAKAFRDQPRSRTRGAAELVGQCGIARDRPRLDECVDTHLQLIRKLPDDQILV